MVKGTDEPTETYTCVICGKPVEIPISLQPDAPHHWECWERAPKQTTDAIYDRVKTLRKAWDTEE